MRTRSDESNAPSDRTRTDRPYPIAGFKQKPIKAILGLPDDVTLIALVIIGRPGNRSDLSEKHRAEETAPLDRRPLVDVVSWNRYEAQSAEH